MRIDDPLRELLQKGIYKEIALHLESNLSKLKNKVKNYSL
jgi:hypothetical protein